MIAYTFTTGAEANAVCDWISARLGYPMTAAVQSGGGVHVEGVVVESYCTVMARFDGHAWAIIADGVTSPLLAEMRDAFPDFHIADPAELPESWFPPFVP